MKDNKHKFRKAIWKRVSRFFPYWRKKLGFLRVLRYKGREDFPIGYLRDGFRIEDIEKELLKLGFEKYYVAWIDIGEILGVRKNNGFEYQYHLRIFSDGEVRGHYELTPEYRAFKHFFDIGKVEKNDEFKNMLGHILK